jgi:hypothetical protein
MALSPAAGFRTNKRLCFSFTRQPLPTGVMNSLVSREFDKLQASEQRGQAQLPLMHKDRQENKKSF